MAGNGALENESNGAPPVDSDDGDIENHHSLPNPEEFYVDRNSSKCISRLGFGFIILLFISAVLGLILGLTGDSRKDETFSLAGSPIPGKDRKILYEKYLLKHGISLSTDFENPLSSQSKALDFLAHEDEMRLSVPKNGPDSRDGYKFLTRYIMALFYYAMDGENWNFDLLFLSKHDTCDWFEIFEPPIGQVGVLCNEYSNEIEGLSFLGNNLQGELPKELGRLTSMTYLESVANQIRGQLPLEFSRLTNLSTFVFAYNDLTGTMPHWITTLTSLAFLYLSNNLLSGTLPENFHYLKELEILGIDDNQFSGDLGSLWQLPNLRHVYVEDNQFTGQLPQKITETNKLLTNFDASNNKLNGKLPVDLFRLSHLEILDLHKNDFTGPLPQDIADDLMYEFLALHENKLSSTIPAALGNIRSLKHLDLSANELVGEIPIELSQLNNLTYLFLANNGFDEGPIPPFVFGYDNLRELSLKQTRRTGTISGLIETMDKLVGLDLGSNGLSGTIPTEVANMQNLVFLLLNENKLSGSVPSQLGVLAKLSKSNWPLTFMNIVGPFSEKVFPRISLA